MSLARVRQQAEGTSTRIGARTVERLQANLASADVVPSPEICDKMLSVLISKKWKASEQ